MQGKQLLIDAPAGLEQPLDLVVLQITPKLAHVALAAAAVAVNICNEYHHLSFSEVVSLHTIGHKHQYMLSNKYGMVQTTTAAMP